MQSALAFRTTARRCKFLDDRYAGHLCSREHATLSSFASPYSMWNMRVRMCTRVCGYIWTCTCPKVHSEGKVSRCRSRTKRPSRSTLQPSIPSSIADSKRNVYTIITARLLAHRSRIRKPQTFIQTRYIDVEDKRTIKRLTRRQAKQ